MTTNTFDSSLRDCGTSAPVSLSRGGLFVFNMQEQITWNFEQENNSERWLPIPGYESLYEVSDQGNVRSVDRIQPHGLGGAMRILRGKTISPWMGSGDYRCVSLSKDGKVAKKKIANIVCDTFNGNPLNLPVVNHLDGNKANDRATNLERCSYSRNNQHAFDTRLKQPSINPGEKTGTHKLFNSQVVEIRSRYRQGESAEFLATQFRVSKSAIFRVVNRTTWNHI